MTVCSRYGSRTSWTIPERFARIAAPFSHPKQQESPLQSPIPVVKGDLGEDFLLPPALCSPRQFHPSPVSELDMLSYLTGDKPNAFPRHSCSNWSVWVVTPPTVSLCLTQSGIFSLLWCLPGVPVWLQSSRLSLLSWAKGLLWGNSVWGTVHACPWAYLPFQAAHSLRQFSPSNISPASPTTFYLLRKKNKHMTPTKEV